jgi:hypothetical protein
MKDRLKSPGVLRALTWASALILIAGVAAFFTVYIGSGDNSMKTAVVNDGKTVPDELPATTAPTVEDVPAAARTAAAEFIVGAVARDDLAGAWKVAHPQLKKDCACTYEEWLKGDINVQFFPSQGASTIRFGANEVSPRRVVLEVLLVPKQGSDLSPTSFYVGLKAVGSGKSEKWLVDYFAPIGSPPVPQDS